MGFGILVGALGLLVLVRVPSSYNGALNFIVIGACVWVLGRYVTLFEFRRAPLPEPVVEALGDAGTGPVGALYLRSFRQETQWFIVGAKEKYGAYANRWLAGIADQYGNVHLRFEQFFYSTLTEAFGPFVALGGPEDYMAPEGAFRVYAKDTDWTKRLDDLAQRAACIVVEVGDSQNLRWEFEHLQRNGLQKKLFVVTQPIHDQGVLTWALRSVFWRLKGIRSVDWQEFARDLGAIGYDLDKEDPGPGSVIGFDENSRGILLTTEAELPDEFVEPMRAWLVSAKTIGRNIPTQCLSCGRSFRGAKWEDGNVRDRFCKPCDRGLSPAEQFLKRYRPLFFGLAPVLLFFFMFNAAFWSWFNNHSTGITVGILVGSAILVWMSNLYQRRIEKRVAGKYLKLAESGDAIAMSYLGMFFRVGKGLPKDDTQAICWLRRAADAGDGLAMYHLGLYYHHGDAGLPQDGVQALNWYLKAAAAGSTSAMNNIGVCYEDGECGLTTHNSEAKNWYEKAANMGNALARKNLERLQQSCDSRVP
jgi:hypothetical protein